MSARSFLGVILSDERSEESKDLQALLRIAERLYFRIGSSYRPIILDGGWDYK